MSSKHQKFDSIRFQTANLSLAQRISASFSVIWKCVNACLPGCYLGCGEADPRCLRWLRGWDHRLMILPAPQGRDPQLSDPKPNKKERQKNKNKRQNSKNLIFLTDSQKFSDRFDQSKSVLMNEWKTNEATGMFWCTSDCIPCPVSCLANWQPCDRSPSLDLILYSHRKPAAPPREAHWPTNKAHREAVTGGGEVMGYKRERNHRNV